MKIFLHYCLGCVTKLPYNKGFATLADLNVVSTLPTLPTIFNNCNGISIPPARDLETELLNGIKIYKTKEAVNIITLLVNEYLSIWEFSDFVQTPPEHWIKVHLKQGGKTNVSAIKPKVYLLGIQAKRPIDKTFDKMQCLDRLKYIISYTPFSFPVFVIYKTNAKRGKKRRAVVNISKLNDIVISDAYSLALQSDIVTSIQQCINLAVLNTALFFYKWLLHLNHPYMFIVITYQGQKIFQGLIMEDINLVAYVQRKIENIFWNV